MMNKRADADFVKQVLSVLIAVLGGLMVIWLGIKIYENYVYSDVQQVKSVLDSIDVKISAIKYTESSKLVVPRIDGAKRDWVLVGWNSKKFSGVNDVMPDRCYFETCICACPVEKGESWFAPNEYDKNKLRDACQKQGICRVYKDVQKVNISEPGKDQNCSFIYFSPDRACTDYYWFGRTFIDSQKKGSAIEVTISKTTTDGADRVLVISRSG